MFGRDYIWSHEDEWGAECGVFVEDGKVFVYDTQATDEVESIVEGLECMRESFIEWGENNTIHDYSDIIDELNALIREYSER